MESLENHLLIAMPSLDDPFFSRTVTYICEHNDQGAMGLIINLPVNITLNELLLQLRADDKKRGENSIDDINEKPNLSSLNNLVLAGGPVAPERGFVLHTPQKGWKSSLALSSEIMITTSKDILLALGTDKAPEKYIVILGYAGWSSGQLEKELIENSWLTTPADGDILFSTPFEKRWQKATEKMGIKIAHLSSDVGHA